MLQQQVIFFSILFVSSALAAERSTGKAEQTKQVDRLGLKNSEIVNLSTDDAEKDSREALQNGAEMINQSDSETKAALRRASDQSQSH